MKNRLYLPLILLGIFSIALFLRLYGLYNNHPLWVDEFSSANEAKAIARYGLNVFQTPGVFIEHYNLTTHFLMGIFFKFFGASPFTARLPIAIVGAFVPMVVFLLSLELLGNHAIAISAALLTTFSYLQITWSRQARGFMILELISLLTVFAFIKLLDKKSRRVKMAIFLITCIFLGIITHPLYFTLLIAIAIHTLFANRNLIIALLTKPLFYIVVLIALAMMFSLGFFNALFLSSSGGLFGTNNAWYYHSFLWREYGLITFLSLAGATIGMAYERKKMSLIASYIIFYLFFLCFIYAPYNSKYVVAIFPFLFILTAISLQKLSQAISKSHISLLTIIFTLVIIANGHKFVNKPKQFYSVNHDFREIALIDYDRIYNLIKNKCIEVGGERCTYKETAIIDTWWDRVYWYLNPPSDHVYIYRWLNEPGLVNGFPKKTPFAINSQGERVIAGTKTRLVATLDDLLKVTKKYSRGFIFIDDASLPAEVQNYAREHFKKEIYLYHYPLDDNPYSIWPATLYSWGFE